MSEKSRFRAEARKFRHTLSSSIPNHLRPREYREVSRRSILKLGVLAAATYYAGDMALENLMWPNRSNEFLGYGYDEKKFQFSPPHEATAVLGGFIKGWDADSTVAPMLETLKNLGHVITLQYGKGPIDPADIAQKMLDWARLNQVDTMRIVGRSMGGMISVEVAGDLKDDLYIPDIAMLTTPDRRDSIVALGRTTVSALRSSNDSPMPYIPGPITRSILDAGARISRDEDILFALQKACEQMDPSVSPPIAVLEGSGEYIDRYDPKEKTRQLNKETKQHLLYPLIFARDSLLDTAATLRGWTGSNKLREKDSKKPQLIGGLLTSHDDCSDINEFGAMLEVAFVGGDKPIERLMQRQEELARTHQGLTLPKGYVPGKTEVVQAA